MARKVRFALEMNNGVAARNMKELREHFSLVKIMEYFNNGKLVIWLRDHYENNKADSIEQLDKTDEELAKKICEIFDVYYDENSQEELKKASLRLERIEQLKKYTTEMKYINNIDNVAFDQDELYDLLDENIDKIYLCGERFHIPLEKLRITYIGINNPIVVVDSKVEVDWQEKEIKLIDVTYDEKYQTVLNSVNEEKESLYEGKVEEMPLGGFMDSFFSSGKVAENEIKKYDFETANKFLKENETHMEIVDVMFRYSERSVENMPEKTFDIIAATCIVQNCNYNGCAKWNKNLARSMKKFEVKK